MLEQFTFQPGNGATANELLLGLKLREVISEVNNMEASTLRTTQAASTHPQMPPSCTECVVKKPCELEYFTDRCYNRLRRHFLLV